MVKKVSPSDAEIARLMAGIPDADDFKTVEPKDPDIVGDKISVVAGDMGAYEATITSAERSDDGSIHGVEWQIHLNPYGLTYTGSAVLFDMDAQSHEARQLGMPIYTASSSDIGRMNQLIDMQEEAQRAAAKVREKSAQKERLKNSAYGSW